MASNYQYVERPVKVNNQCRFCDRKYKVFKNEEKNKKTNESRNKIFESKNNKTTISERLSSVNIKVENDPGLSNTICNQCETQITTLEKAKEIRVKWSGVKRKVESADLEDEDGGVPDVKKQKTENNNEV